MSPPAVMPRVSGRTRLICHLGVPTDGFRAPLIYNPWFAHSGTDAVVVPMGVEAADFPALIALLARLRNFAGALVTMPHKVTAAGLLDEASPAVRACGAANAVRVGPGGRLEGDMFDGEGFVRAMRDGGRDPAGLSALVVGTGGVGSAIAASLALAGAARLVLHDADADRAEALAARLRAVAPGTGVTVGPPDPAGHAVVVNATPLGAGPADPLPLDPARIEPDALVGEVVLSPRATPLLRAARARGCATQDGLAMLFAQIPAYLRFFGLPEADTDTLRRLAALDDQENPDNDRPAA